MRKFVAAVFALLVCLPVGARDLLVIGTHFERVYERGQEGEVVGFGPEIVRLIAERLGHRPIFELYPWARAQALVAQGKADILVGPYKTFERQQLMAFSKLPFYQDQMVFYVRKGMLQDWSGDYAELAEQRIAIVNGWSYGAAFDKARPQLRLDVVNSVDSGLKMLAAQHAQMFASNRRNTEPVLGRLGLSGQLTMLPRVIDVQEGYFAFPKRPASDALRKEFDAEFQRLVDSGELKRLGLRHEVNVP
ncbi:substrate-binding periplasmic protein [Pseudoduganella violaceinigra]|uniref:substrate-binding periplasmic protein n=1 Tax=Pseudoduganella violaceinigra TaxID=246602 RepID=UPI000421DE44|nr:transporter substrate-binding domain-containing protein [Pseudoduganella violaceinigra]